MTDFQEKETADQSDREVSDRGGLAASCFAWRVAGGLLVDGAMALFPAG